VLELLTPGCGAAIGRKMWRTALQFRMCPIRRSAPLQAVWRDSAGSVLASLKPWGVALRTKWGHGPVPLPDPVGDARRPPEGQQDPPSTTGTCGSRGSRNTVRDIARSTANMSPACCRITLDRG
jgi:hypothetical protein